MKKIILITLIFINYTTVGQDFNWTKNAKDHNPNPKNELSKYFKKQIPKKLLRKAYFSPKKNNITLSFLINNQSKPYALNINTFGNSLLKEKVVKAFENYPLEKLNLKSIDTKNKYHLQLISKEGNKNIFNCSSKVIVETPPICNNCENLEYYEDIKNCLSYEVKKHLYKEFDFSLLNNIDEDTTDLFIKYSASSSGLQLDKKTKVPLFFKNQVIEALKSFPEILKEGSINQIKHEPFYSSHIIFKKGETPIYKEKNIEYDEFSKPSLKNPLSLYFLEKLSKKDLQEIDLNNIYNRFIISFEMNKDKTLFNISTNARSKEIDQKIISHFKSFPIEKLNFVDTTPFNRYSMQLLSFSNNKTIVNASTKVNYLRIPVFPGCERSNDAAEVKKCFSKGVQKTFAQKFDADLPNRLGLTSGRLKIFISFKINKKGNVTNIFTKLSRPSFEISNEVERVMKLIPKMTFAPIHNGKPVNIKYSIPFTLIIK